MSGEAGTKRFGSALDEVSKDGQFKRTAALHRNFISRDDPVFQPEANRYHLYMTYACPWANGSLTTLKMKGLEGIVGVSIAHPVWQRTRPDDPEDTHAGWVFRSPGDPPIMAQTGPNSTECDDALIPDTVNGCQSIRDLYALSKDQRGGNCTTPLLWDKKTGMIVSNESVEINRMFNSEFRELSSAPDSLDLFPADLEGKFEELNSIIYPHLNDGVYRCGLCQSQTAYDAAVDNVFDALDKVEEVLSTRRYILDNSRITMLDIRLTMTLFRFDEVYNVYFKCNKRKLSSYPNISNYCRELWQHPHVGENVNMKHIKEHYYRSHPRLNTFGIIPAGPNAAEDFMRPHDRDVKFPMA